MRAFLRSPWFAGLVALTAVTTCCVIGFFLVDEPNIRAFFRTRWDIFPLAFLILAWMLAVVGATLFVPPARRARPSYASLAMLLFSGFFSQVESVTAYGMVQALGLCLVVTWFGFGRIPEPTAKPPGDSR